MSDDSMLLYTAVYDDVSTALTDLSAVEQLHRDELIGKFDAAVIDQENGKPHIVKRLDRPRLRVIPEAFGAGALPRQELHDAANELGTSQAGMIVVGEPTIEQGLDKAIVGAARVVKRSVDASTDEISSELQEALKGYSYAPGPWPAGRSASCRPTGIGSTHGALGAPAAARAGATTCPPRIPRWPPRLSLTARARRRARR